ncbi:hypothetical protein L7F22_003618 [Adiantum nelumboides]|nr:hypothetical protein [Adiantum nelumboides]
MSFCTWKKCGQPQLEHAPEFVSILGNNQAKCWGIISTAIEVGSQNIIAQFHVITVKDVPDGIILGMPLSRKVLEIQNAGKMQSSKPTKNEDQEWSLVKDSITAVKMETDAKAKVIEDVPSPTKKISEELEADQAVASAD